MKIEREDVFEQARIVVFTESRKRGDLLRALNERWTEPVLVMHWHVERFH